MPHFKKGRTRPWHEPEAEIFRRYLKEKKVMQSLQPALTLLYKLPIKPTDLYQFFAEFLEYGATTMVKLSLLRAVQCFIKNQIHVTKRQVKQLKEHIAEDGVYVQPNNEDGTNLWQEILKDFIHKIGDKGFVYDKTAKAIIQIEREIDAATDQDLESILQYIQDQDEIDPSKFLSDISTSGTAADADAEADEEAGETVEDCNENVSVLSHGKLAFGMNPRLRQKKKVKRKFFRKPIKLAEPSEKSCSTDSSDTSDSDVCREFKMTSKFTKEDIEHKRLLRVLPAKQLKGRNDWLPSGRRCEDKLHDQKQKYGKTDKIRIKNRKSTPEKFLEDEYEGEGVPDPEFYAQEQRTKSPEKEILEGRKHKPHHKYRNIGISSVIAAKEKYHSSLGHGTDEDDEDFDNSLAQRNEHDIKFRPNTDFVFEFPLNQVIQAQKWIDDNFMEDVWKLNEPLPPMGDVDADDDEDNYDAWVEDYYKGKRANEPLECQDDNLAVSTNILPERKLSPIDEAKISEKKRSSKVMEENELCPVVSVPLLKTNKKLGPGEEKSSEKAKRFVENMFEEKYGKRLMKQFQFDVLDD